MHGKVLLGSFFLLALAAAGCSDDTNPSPPSTPDGGGTKPDGNAGDVFRDVEDTIAPGDMSPCESGSTIANGTFTLTHAGVEYGYVVNVPPSYDGTKRTPLVVNWPGAGAGGAEQAFYSGMNATSDAEGFIVVYPTAPDRTWAAGSCCAQFRDGGNPDRDDIGFARALVAEITRIGCIDSKKIYSTGMSTGGFMSHRLACEAADIFAAVAPVAGKMGVLPCTPSRPVPVLHFHGTMDQTIPYDSPMFSPENVNVPDMMANWAMRDGCTKGPATTFEMGNVTCKTWWECSGGSEVTLCTAECDGHCWPGATFCLNAMPFTTAISASQSSWKFLRRFALP
jgi:polyhydroxybutyrate depolymerase